MNTARFFSAVGTPLTNEENLDHEALEAHLSDQWRHGIGGILVAGTMGNMQLLRDQTYRQVAQKSVEFSKNVGEVFVGAGDCSYYRTLDRIRYLNDLRIDGVVVLTPFFFRFSQTELIQYYTALANECKAPLYLYDLPQRTNCKIELETVLQLAKHPNIRGIKCSDEPSYARRIIDTLGDSFRVIVAQPMMVDVFLKFGIYEHLDGIFALAPALAVSIGKYAAAGDWSRATDSQKKLSAVLRVFRTYGGNQAFTTLLNARGVPGNYVPRPFESFGADRRESLLAEPEVVEFLATASSNAVVLS